MLFRSLAKYLADQNPEAFAASPLARECGSASNVSAEALACHFRSGDDWASQVIDGSARALGCTLALIHLCCAVEDFFVTGGFATALGADFGLRVGHHAAHSAWPTDIDWSRAVHILDPNVDYGLTGAALIPLFAAPGSTMAASCG